MDGFEKLVEYYDELYPCDDSQISFFKELNQDLNHPQKFLRIGCGTGLLETKLAKSGFNVTGIESIKSLLNSASLRYRVPNMDVKFFHMSSSEMRNFLGEGFYDTIVCLNDRLIFMSSENSIQKFFNDCKQLLSKTGKLVLELTNFENYTSQNNFALPERESIRSKISHEISKNKEKEFTMSANLQNSSGQLIKLYDNTKIMPLTAKKIESLSLKAGFSSVNFFQDFVKNPFTQNSARLLCVIE